MARSIVLSLAFVAIACGSARSDRSGVEVTGPLGFVPVENLGFRAAAVSCPMDPDTTWSASQVSFMATSVPVTCAALSGLHSAGSSLVRAGVGMAGVPDAVEPGTYEFGPTPPFPGYPTPSVVVERRGEGGVLQSARGMAGSLTFTHVSSERVAGSLSVTLEDGGTVSGTFDVVPCDAPCGLLCCCTPPTPGLCTP